MAQFSEFLTTNLLSIYLLIFAIFLGFELISKVPSILHTPLMSGANAISGIVLIGAVLLIRRVDPQNTIALISGSVAIALAMINIVGGFAVTHRMLSMFRKKDKND